MDTPDLPPVDWRKAVCKRADPNLFLVASAGRVARAREICRGCPIVDDCREYAIADPSLHYVWGATTKDERDAERHRRRPLGLYTPARQATRTKPCDQCGQPLEGVEKRGKRHAECACGTVSGPVRHARRGEPPCAKCAAYNAARMRAAREADHPAVAVLDEDADADEGLVWLALQGHLELHELPARELVVVRRHQRNALREVAAA